MFATLLLVRICTFTAIRTPTLEYTQQQHNHPSTQRLRISSFIKATSAVLEKHSVIKANEWSSELQFHRNNRNHYN